MKLFWVTLLLGLVSACAAVSEDPDHSDAAQSQNATDSTPDVSTSATIKLEDIAQARVLWGKANLKNYSFTQKRSCYCRSEYTKAINVVVVDGKVTSATYEDSGEPVATGVRKTVRTVSDWLDYIATRQLNTPFEYEATFDPDAGYPIYFRVDQRKNVADDEEQAQFSAFKILP